MTEEPELPERQLEPMKPPGRRGNVFTDLQLLDPPAELAELADINGPEFSIKMAKSRLPASLEVEI